MKTRFTPEYITELQPNEIFVFGNIRTVSTAAYYGIPDRLVERALTFLPDDMLEIIRKFDNIEIEEKKQLTTPTFNKRDS